MKCVSHLSGAVPWPARRNQAGTSIMVELGNGDTFFFDLGNGSVHNIIAMGFPPALINDIFITHLHADHYADLPYMLPFTAIEWALSSRYASPVRPVVPRNWARRRWSIICGRCCVGILKSLIYAHG